MNLLIHLSSSTSGNISSNGRINASGSCRTRGGILIRAKDFESSRAGIWNNITKASGRRFSAGIIFEMIDFYGTALATHS